LIDGKASDSDSLDLASAAYEAQGFTPEATELLHRAIVLSPRNPDYYVHFAGLCLDHSSFEAGVAMLTSGIANVPRTATLYLARGILQIEAGHYEQGQADFETADRLDPSQAFSAEAIGMTEMQRSNLDEATRTTRLRLHAHPNDAFLHYLLAQILIQRGAQPGSAEFKDAISEARQACLLNPDLAVAHDLLGDLYVKSGDIPRAIDQLQLALKIDGSDQSALYHLIQALRRAGQSQETPELLKRLASLRAAERDSEALRNRYRLIDLDTPTRSRDVPISREQMFSK
jgi:tetratricopeptide (TPR) repeat protein